MATNAELTAQLGEMTTRATAAETRATQLTGQIDTLIAERNTARKGYAERGRQIDTLEREKRELAGQLRAYKGSATKARGEITILKAKLSPEHRPIGAMKPPKTEEDNADRAAALEAAFSMGPTQIVFSDGKREIRELAALVVTGEASWRETPRGRVLNSEVSLEPGDCQRQQMDLAGFGLLNEAGDQVGYCALPEPIRILRNQRFLLPHNTICF
jgi:hypothetical protein